MSLTLLSLHSDVLKYILTAVIGRDTYSIARLAINKHIYSVANEVWFAMVRGRLLSDGITGAQETRNLLCNVVTSASPDRIHDITLYADGGYYIACNLELRIRINLPCVSIFTQRYNIDYKVIPSLYTAGYRFPIMHCFTRSLPASGGAHYCVDEQSNENSSRNKRIIAQMMHRILPELADLFTY